MPDEVSVDVPNNGANASAAAEVNQSTPTQRVRKPRQPAVKFAQLFRFGDVWDKCGISFAVVCGLGTGAVMPLQTLILGDLINATNNPATFEQSVDRIALYMVFVAIAAFFLSFFGSTLSFLSSERQIRRIRSSYMRALMRQDLAFFDKGLATQAAGRLAEDTVAIQAGMGEKLFLIFAGFSQFVGNFILAFSVSKDSWRMALVVLALVPAVGFVFFTLFSLIKTLSGKGDDAYAKAGEVLNEALSLIRTVTAFGGEEAEIQRYDAHLETAEKAGTRKGYTSGISSGVFVLVLNVMYAIGLYAGARFILLNREEHPECMIDMSSYDCFSGGQVSGDNTRNNKPNIITAVKHTLSRNWSVQVIQSLFAMVTGASAMGLAGPNIQYVASAQAAAFRIFQVIDTVPAIDASSDKGIKPDTVIGRIEFKDVTFAYPTRAHEPVLRGFNLVIEPGKTFALCGPSGSGKSTIIALIERWYDPQEGGILLDGRDLREYNIKWLRNHMALVNQEPQLLPLSIQQNIALGRPDASAEDVQRAASAANAHQFISALPSGYDTPVSSTQLSGGEKQRVAIARAIIRSAPILLLDEATSALDTASERAIQRDLDALIAPDQAGGKHRPTVIVIAHRLSTITNADTIIVLENGTVRESGCHTSLLQVGGLYSALWAVQQVQTSSQHGPSASVETKLGSDTSAGVVTLTPAADASKVANKYLHPNAEAADDESSTAWRQLSPVAFGKVWKYMEPQFGWILLGILSSAANGVILPAFSILLSRFIAIFFLADGEEMKREAAKYMGLFFAVGVGSFVVSLLAGISWSHATEKFIRRLRRDTFAALLRQDIGFYDMSSNSVGRIATRLGINAARLKLAMGPRLGEKISSVSTLIAGLIIAFVASWQLTLIIIALGPLVVLSARARNMVTFGLGNVAEAYAEAGSVAADAVSAMRTVSAFNLQESICERFDKCIARPSQKAVHYSWKLGFGYGFASFMQPISASIVFWAGAKLINNGSINFQDLLQVYFALQFGSMGLTYIAELTGDLGVIRSSLRSLFAILERKTLVDGTEDAYGVKDVSIAGTLRFSNVNFCYPTRPERPVLRNLSLEIKAGQIAAIVGRSGSGKSSIIQLLLRFYNPSSGTIFVDDRDVTEFQPRWLRDHVGWVQQEAPLFAESVQYNIAYGRSGGLSNKPKHENDPTPPPADVVSAGQAANCTEFVDKFERGYATFVGERGSQLSGGQKQRVAIARSIIRRPRILLLDEATSALDSESERIVQESIDKLLEQAKSGDRSMTTIIIAHRLSTVRNADVVFVIDDGQVAESGSHDELIANPDSIFAQLVRAQSSSQASAAI